MNKLFLSICLSILVMSCGNSSNTSEEISESQWDSIADPADGTVSTEPSEDKPIPTIIEDSDLDSITRRLKGRAIEGFRRRWVNLSRDSTGFYILQPSDGQNPYVEITQENDVYVLVLGDMQSLWYGAIVDFTITDADEMVIQAVPWNNENKRYGSAEDYKPQEFKYSYFSREKGIITREGQYYLDIDRVIKDKYRVVVEESEF